MTTEKQTKHTPGRAAYCWHCKVPLKDGMICPVHNAAPELLTALKDCLGVLNSCAEDTTGTRSEEFFKRKAAYCTSVIQKAEGH